MTNAVEYRYRYNPYYVHWSKPSKLRVIRMDVDMNINEMLEKEKERYTRIIELQERLVSETDTYKIIEIEKELIRELGEGYLVNRSLILYIMAKERMMKNRCCNIDKDEVRKLIEEFERIERGAGISDVHKWMRRAYKVLKEVVRNART